MGFVAQALSELQSALAAAEQGTEDVRREVDTERQRGGVAGAELSELRQRNAELLAHVAELEEDLQHSDADLEHAISQLEAHGIAMDDADDGGDSEDSSDSDEAMPPEQQRGFGGLVGTAVRIAGTALMRLPL